MDMASIQAAIGGLKTATDIVNGVLQFKLTAEMQGKVIELQTVILSAQSSALSANSEQFALLQRVGNLEKQIADLEAWEAEKKRYALTELSVGAFAYVVKPKARGTEPLHAICANCYEHGKKSVLHWITTHIGEVIFTCNGCKSEVRGYSDDQFKLEAIAP